MGKGLTRLASGEVPSHETNAFISSSRGMTVPRGYTVQTFPRRASRCQQSTSCRC